MIQLDVGATALEHLAKACLAKRSPALLAEFKGEASFRSVLLLLEINTKSGQLGAEQLGQLRTVGLRAALERTRLLVMPTANWQDLLTLADMRDGSVHAATDDEVAMRLVVAFVQHVNTLLADLRRDGAGFWGSQQSVAVALLSRSRDRVTHIVAVKLASARIRLAELAAGTGDGPVRPVITLVASPRPVSAGRRA